MSIDTITSRIQELQSRLAQMTPVETSSLQSLDSTSFASALRDAGTTSATATADDGGVTGADIVKEASTAIGVPYVWGGNSMSKGVDCSGLVQQTYAKFGISLPRLSADQARSGRAVASLEEAQPGDLIAWNNSSRNNGADHIAIYVGNGKMIEAPRTGLDVRLVDVPSTPDYIRRILPDAGTTATSSTSATQRTTAAATSDTAVSGVPYANLFNAAGAKYGVSPSLLSAVAKQESGYRADAVSPAGARGLMQLMPGTAKGLGVTDATDPTQAVDGAARMLRDLQNRFGSTQLALAAYNAGPGAVLKYGGIPPYSETQHYVSAIMSNLRSAS
ncbi:lytic transglycosylase [Nocardioides mangrovicus]|uniref:Lytic transglycosylase n=1 Tax=Nocardioides mangrovicus TaxID=2478913 RepID=A0A3L8P015_9ACTN|nr:transglycosylase SLT domain-containing protein [Nocardioides mangrovicus]RLV48775.1 lytic transglycosylase [Nocardioides mangrovicus]